MYVPGKYLIDFLTSSWVSFQRSLIAIFEPIVKLSTDRYINSAAARRSDSYSRGRIVEYTVTTQRAANCKASTTVVHASQIISRQRQRHLAHETPRCALARSARSPRGFASSRATHVAACVRPAILRGLFPRKRAILSSFETNVTWNTNRSTNPSELSAWTRKIIGRSPNNTRDR